LKTWWVKISLAGDPESFWLIDQSQQLAHAIRHGTYHRRRLAGRQGLQHRGQLFAAVVDGRTTVTRSTTPFLDAARALLAEGVYPAMRLVMRHAGADHDASRSTIGVAAGLRVKDASHGPPVFATYVP
jgi:hypothetical protein